MKRDIVWWARGVFVFMLSGLAAAFILSLFSQLLCAAIV